MNDDESPDLIQELSRSLLTLQCAVLRNKGEGTTSILAANCGVVDRQGRPIRAVLFLGTGAFSDDDIRKLKDYCLGFSQDGITPGERQEKVSDIDNLQPPKDGNAPA